MQPYTEPDPELTADEKLMHEVGCLDVWHAERETGCAAVGG